MIFCISDEAGRCFYGNLISLFNPSQFCTEFLNKNNFIVFRIFFFLCALTHVDQLFLLQKVTYFPLTSLLLINSSLLRLFPQSKHSRRPSIDVDGNLPNCLDNIDSPLRSTAVNCVDTALHAFQSMLIDNDRLSTNVVWTHIDEA